jgi:hypothetical protein
MQDFSYWRIAIYRLVARWLEYFFLINSLQFEYEKKKFFHKNRCKLYAHAAGIELDKFPEEQQLLLKYKWDKLHIAFPNDKTYSSRLFMKNAAKRSWSNGKPAITKIDHENYNKFVKLDPDNALYDYTHAGEILYTGSTMRRSRSSGKIVDRLKLMEALPFYLNGLRKGTYKNYTYEIKKRRLQMIRSGESAAIKAWNQMLLSIYLPDYWSIEYIYQALPMWVDELIKTGKKIRP